jgi:hypothetical protein
MLRDNNRTFREVAMWANIARPIRIRTAPSRIGEMRRGD